MQQAAGPSAGWRQAALAGGAAGLVVGLVSYLINGVPASVLFFGVVMAIVFLYIRLVADRTAEGA